MTDYCSELIYKDYVHYLMGWAYFNLLMFDSNM